jgi:NAD(P)-dependent dehydrogenase (short-subunit alcohol dehydrogenase family)
VAGVDLHGADLSFVRHWQGDVRSVSRAEEVVQQVVQEFGGLHLLVLNAGVTADRMLWRMSEEEWDRVVDTNLKGVWGYLRAAAPVLRQQGDGQVVVVSSINALRGKLGQSNYAASKAGCIALARTAARELGPSGVTVNVIAPGMVATPLTRQLPQEVLSRAIQETVLGRLVELEEVAAAIVFLLTPSARAITGAVLQVDAGQWMG